MASKLRTPALVGSLVCAVLIIVVELGGAFEANASIFEGLGGRLGELGDSFGSLGQDGASETNSEVGGFGDLEGLLDTDAKDVPGLAIAALIYLDVMLLTMLILFTLPLIVSPRVLAQLQGCFSCVLGVVVILMGLFTLLAALVSLFLMIGLLLAIPFGTIVYMILYADFDTTEAAAIMSTLMFLKILMTVLLLIAHERFLLNIGMIALIATSIVAMVVISFLHNFPPTFLVSITDTVAALIVAILAIIWGFIHAIGGIIGIVTMLKGLDKLKD